MFLLLFLFLFCIIVFDVIYILLPLCVICSKIVLKIINLIYSQVFRDFVRFPVFTVRTLVENLLVCGVLSSSHRSTPHTIGAKRLHLGYFCPHVCGLSHFEDLIRFYKSFSVYPALEVQSFKNRS